MSTAWIWHEAFNWHNTGNGSGFLPPGGFVQPHESFDAPASKGRWASLVQVSGFDRRMSVVAPVAATDDELRRVHTPDYLERLEGMDATGGDAGEVAPFGPLGLAIAKLAAGAVVTAVRTVLRGEADNAYALVRPAGHHAEADRGRGFCIYANVAVAVRAAQAEFGLSRVAVVDWDVHHGNGTQSIFWDDPSVLTISLHQDRLYPADSGAVTETGGPSAPGTALNVALPAGTGDGGYAYALEQVVVPALRRFRPELVVVSSGMDAGAVDPLGRMVVTSEGFRAMARAVLDAAAEITGGKVVFAHEGGYSAHYVPFCGMAVLEELTGLDSGVEDPYLPFFSAYPQARLEDWQRAVVDTCAQLVPGVPAPDGDDHGPRGPVSGGPERPAVA